MIKNHSRITEVAASEGKYRGPLQVWNDYKLNNSNTMHASSTARLFGQCETPGGGGGVLSLEKGTDCGPTDAEGWLSRPKMAKKRGLSSYHIV